MYLLRLGMRGIVSINSTLFSKFSEKIWDTPVKNTPTRTGPKSLSPTRPENILKNVSWSRTGFGPVQGNSGFRVAPQVLSWDK